MAWWKVVLGYIRKVLNGLNAAGVIPSKDSSPTDSTKGPLDTPHK